MKAFPQHIFDEGQILIGEDLGGMNLRDWFAGLALQSIIADGGCAYDGTGSDGKFDEDAAIAYYYADSMMLARSKNGRN